RRIGLRMTGEVSDVTLPGTGRKPTFRAEQRRVLQLLLAQLTMAEHRARRVHGSPGRAACRAITSRHADVPRRWGCPAAPSMTALRDRKHFARTPPRPASAPAVGDGLQVRNKNPPGVGEAASAPLGPVGPSS